MLSKKVHYVFGCLFVCFFKGKNRFYNKCSDWLAIDLPPPTPRYSQSFQEAPGVQSKLQVYLDYESYGTNPKWLVLWVKIIFLYFVFNNSAVVQENPKFLTFILWTYYLA